MTTKTCTKCKETKATTEFGKNKRAKDGLKYQCNACNAKVSAAWREANGGNVANALRSANYRATEHGREVTRAANIAYRLTPRGNAIHKASMLKYQQGLTASVKSSQACVEAAFRRSDLPSADLYGGLTYTEAVAMTLPLVEERLRLEADTGVAHHIDHIIPLAAGGTHTKDNLQVLTAQENIEKGAKE